MRIFNDEVNDNDEEKDNNEDSDHGRSWTMNEKRKKDNEITALKSKIKTLETRLNDMRSTSRVTG
jgi:hypothetical protein